LDYKMHYVKIESEISDVKKGRILGKIINFDNLHSENLDVKTHYDNKHKLLITEIKCLNLRTLQNTIYDLIKTQELAEKIMEI